MFLVSIFLQMEWYLSILAIRHGGIEFDSYIFLQFFDNRIYYMLLLSLFQSRIWHHREGEQWLAVSNVPMLRVELLLHVYYNHLLNPKEIKQCVFVTQ